MSQADFTNKNANEAADIFRRMHASSGGPVLPVHLELPRPFHHGITKRELFAGLALQGVLANPECTDHEMSAMASDAVRFADLLLAELAKEPTP